MACVIAEKLSCWRLATITQKFTLNKSAIDIDGSIATDPERIPGCAIYYYIKV
jgi:hypothetical protein